LHFFGGSILTSEFSSVQLGGYGLDTLYRR